MKRLTYGQRMDLALKVWGYALILTMLSLVLVITGVGVFILAKAIVFGAVFLTIGVICFILSHIAFFISMRLEFRH